MCRGTACEELFSWSREYRENAYIQTATLLPNSEANLSTVGMCYRCVGTNGLVTNWYLTEEEAYEAAEAQDIDTELQGAQLTHWAIAPLPKEFTVEFERDAKGRLFTRVHVHPELDGRSGQGKVFFPDRRFTSADIGPATVSVSMERETFGFLTGRMTRCDGQDAEGCPSYNTVLDWAWSGNHDADDLLIINHPARGRYYAVANHNSVYAFRLVCTDVAETGQVERLEPFVDEDVKRYLERRASFKQLFAEEVWGADVDISTLLAQFHESEALLYGRRVWDVSRTYASDTIRDAAVHTGFLTQYVDRKTGAEAIGFDKDDYFGLLAMPLSDVEKLAAEVSAFNAKVDKAISRALR